MQKDNNLKSHGQQAVGKRRIVKRQLHVVPRPPGSLDQGGLGLSDNRNSTACVSGGQLQLSIVRSNYLAPENSVTSSGSGLAFGQLFQQTLCTSATEVLCSMLTSCGLEAHIVRYHHKGLSGGVKSFEEYVRTEFVANPCSLLSQAAGALMTGEDLIINCPVVRVCPEGDTVAPLVNFAIDTVMVDLPMVEEVVTVQEQLAVEPPRSDTQTAVAPDDDDLFFPMADPPPVPAPAPGAKHHGDETVIPPPAASVLLPQLYVATLWPFMLHIASQAVLDYNQGPLGIIFCASQHQTMEVHKLLESLADKLQLVIHNVFIGVPLMPPNRRADIILGTPMRVAALIPTSASPHGPKSTIVSPSTLGSPTSADLFWPSCRLPDQCPPNIEPAAFWYYSLAHVGHLIVFTDVDDGDGGVSQSALRRIIGTTHIHERGLTLNMGVLPTCQITIVRSQKGSVPSELLDMHAAKSEVQALRHRNMTEESVCMVTSIDLNVGVTTEGQLLSGRKRQRDETTHVSGDAEIEHCRLELTLHNVSTMSRWMQLKGWDPSRHPLVLSAEEEVREWAAFAKLDLMSLTAVLQVIKGSVSMQLVMLVGVEGALIQPLLSSLADRFHGALIDGLHTVLATVRPLGSELVSSPRQPSTDGWVPLLDIPIPSVGSCDLSPSMEKPADFFILIRNVLPRLNLSVFGSNGSSLSPLVLARTPLRDLLTRLYLTNANQAGTTGGFANPTINSVVHSLLQYILQTNIDSGAGISLDAADFVKASFMAKVETTIDTSNEDLEDTLIDVALCVSVPTAQVAVALSHAISGQQLLSLEVRTGLEEGRLLQFFVDGPSSSKIHIALAAVSPSPQLGLMCEPYISTK